MGQLRLWIQRRLCQSLPLEAGVAGAGEGAGCRDSQAGGSNEASPGGEGPCAAPGGCQRQQSAQDPARRRCLAQAGCAHPHGRQHAKVENVCVNGYRLQLTHIRTHQLRA